MLEQIIASLDLPYEDLAKDWRSSVDRDHRLRANQRWAAMTNQLPSEPAQPSPATFPYVPLTSPRPTGLTILTETPIGYGTGRGGR